MVAALRAVAAVVAVVAGVAALTIDTAHRVLTDPRTFDRALVRVDAYDRVYREVLPDPAVSGALDPLLGVAPGTSAVLSTNLRTLVPPATLRAVVEASIGEVVRYVGGEADRLDPSVDLAPVVDSVHAVVDEYLADAAPQVWTALAAAAEDYRPALEQGLRRALDPPDGAGATAHASPTLAGELADLVVAVIPAEQRQHLHALVEARLRDDDVGGALTLVIPALRSAGSSAGVLSGRAADVTPTTVPTPEATAGAAASTASAAAAAATLSTATQPRVPSSTAWRTLPELRRRADVAALARTVLAAAAVLAGLSLVALTWRRRRRSGLAALRWAGPLVVSVGAGTLVARPAVRALTDAALGALDRRGAGLPPSVQRLLSDVWAEVGRQLDGGLRNTALAWLGVGLAVTVATFGLLPAIRWAHSPRRVLVPAGITAALSLAFVAVPMWPGAVGADEPTCNGLAELCDRPYNRVVQAASHNAMAASDYRFLAPVQDLSITGQLELGVRTLLLDTHYWEPPSVTDRYLEHLPGSLAARVRTLLARRLEARPGAWLCHNLCALGAIPAEAGFAEVAAFLDRHPDNVVTLVVQDGTTPADTEAALRAAGLFDRVVTPPRPGEAWPTLGRLIAERRNVVVFAESARDATRSWYPNFFDYAMDTPYNVDEVGALSCAPNRGGSGKELFLVNRWVTRTAAGRDEAAVVNQRDAIVEQARRCRDERGAAPTMIAVDFADTGDVVGAVTELNRHPAGVP